MRYLLLLSLFLVGCIDKDLVISNGKKLCACRGGLWFTRGTMANCTDGATFYDIDELNIVDTTCN